ncbi:reverse transcriptase [Gossypium australe]|uniref:Reverse transcriptase n=1 Tax=Gossypium australe TaxID=47621 RepID=A0A5B6VPP8_9ROSI|nr:reverse transcriptase [Gossypium australe]
MNWQFMGFYSSPNVIFEGDSWNLLKELGRDQGLPWIVCGDFNEILYSFEKKGGLLREEEHIRIFYETLIECQLEDLGYTRHWFSWERGNRSEINIRERLDRRVTKSAWFLAFLNFSVKHLPHSFSNHYLLLIHTNQDEQRSTKRGFKFEAWLTKEESFEEEIRRLWEGNHGHIADPLNKIRVGLQKWANGLRKKVKRVFMRLHE